MKLRKTLAALLTCVFAASILLGGTMTWRSMSQTATNEFFHTDTVGARLHDDFNGNATKDVYVENYFSREDGGKPVLARIRLDEYLEVGPEAAINRLDPNRHAKSITKGSKIDDPSTWSTYVLGADTDPFRAYYALSFGGETVYMPTFNKNPRSLAPDVNGTWDGTVPNDTTHLDDYTQYIEGDTLEGKAYYSDTDFMEELHTAKKTQHATVLTMADWKAQGSPIGPYWVYDTDGWAYWAQAIMPGETTGLLLDGIQYVSPNDDDCFYSLNVIAQFSTPDDWGDPEKQTGFYDPTKGKPPTEDAAALLNQAAQAVGPEAGAGWQSLNQVARNDIRRPPEARPTELIIFEKEPDGTPTETPIPGTEFFLFTADGEQVGGSYTTDDLGSINVSLKPGDYYFEETYPSLGFAFDQEDGKPVTHYPFTVEKKDKNTVIAYNRRLTGPLTIMKVVHNETAGELTQEQKEQKFTFTVTFSDNGSYPCQIDGGEEFTVSSGGALQLRHGQTAVFPAIPVGVQYTVVETAAEGYEVTSQGSHGNITPEGQEALFTNVVGQPEPEAPILTVTKVLAGEYPTKDSNKEFHFTLKLGDKVEEFTLKNGETKTFDQVKPEDVYLITEQDAFPDGYSLTTVNAAGTIMEGETKAVFTNTYVGRTQVEIFGEKTWNVDEAHASLIPASVPIRLYGDGLLVKEQTVKPDGEGKWRYIFYAPKYSGDGKEISYTVREAPIDYFLPIYHGNDIENVYTDPVSIDPPTLEKAVEGANAPKRTFTFLLQSEDGGPMPEGASGAGKLYTLEGAGKEDLGTFTFKRPGTFRYTLYEVKGGGSNWSYDTARYTLTFTVTAQDGKLVVQKSLTKDGETADKLLFRNTYTSSGEGGGGGGGTVNIELSGQKHWEHGENPQENRPEKIVVLVYADGELACQEEVTGEDGWKYSFLVPKYTQRGKKVVYTVGEKPIPGYQCQVDGYDLINTYVGEGEPTPTSTPTPTSSEEPTPTPPEPSQPSTGGTPVTPTPTPTPPEPTSVGEETPVPTPSETPTPTPAGTPVPPPSGGGGSTPSDPPNTVKTGDTGELGLWLAVTALGGAGTLLCLGYLFWTRRRYTGKRLMKG